MGSESKERKTTRPKLRLTEQAGVEGDSGDGMALIRTYKDMHHLIGVEVDFAYPVQPSRRNFLYKEVPVQRVLPRAMKTSVRPCCTYHFKASVLHCWSVVQSWKYCEAYLFFLGIFIFKLVQYCEVYWSTSILKVFCTCFILSLVRHLRCTVHCISSSFLIKLHFVLWEMPIKALIFLLFVLTNRKWRTRSAAHGQPGWWLLYGLESKHR